jgi:hypothetical protein
MFNSLGALHDDGYNCPVTNNYIMVLSPLYNYNPLNLLKYALILWDNFFFLFINHKTLDFHHAQ